MKISMLLKFNTICNLFFGLMLLFIPGVMMALFGVNLGIGGVYMARMAGGAFLGFAAITWYNRDLPEEQLRLTILPALFVWFAVGILPMLYGQLSGITNFLGWFTVLLSAFFLVGYAFFLLRPIPKEKTRVA